VGGMLDLTASHGPRRPPSFRHHQQSPQTPPPTGHDQGSTNPVTTINPGIYRIRFSGGPSQNFGDGIGVFRDGTINGGDPGFVYRGSYEIRNGHISAKINIKRWNVIPNPIMNLSEYDLIVESRAHTDGVRFSVEAQIQQQPNIRIQIDGERLEDAI